LGAPADQQASYALFLSCIHPEDRDAVHRFASRCIATGELFDIEFRIFCPDGSVRWAASTGRAFLNEKGTPLRAAGITQDITPRKKAESALLLSECLARTRAEELETFMQTAPANVFIAHDPEGENITANRTGYATLRMDPAQTVELPPLGVARPFQLLKQGRQVPPEEFPLRMATRSGATISGEFDLLFEDGTRRHLYGTAAPIRDGEGRIRGAVGTFLEVTELKRTEAELARSRRMFERIAATMPEVLFVYDLQLRTLVYTNGAISSSLGYAMDSLGSLREESITELIHPEDRGFCPSTEKLRTLPDGEVITQEYRIRHANGSYRWMRLRIVAFSRDADQSVLQVLGLAQDTTQEHQVQQAFLENEKVYRALTDLSPQIVWRTDAQGNLDYCNDNWRKFTGMDLSQSKRGGWLSAVHPDFRERIHLEWAHATASSSDSEIEIPLRRADGLHRWHLGRSVAVRDVHGKIVRWMGIAFDVHERKQAELALRESEERFRTLADTAPVMIWMTDEHGQPAYFNKPMLEFIGPLHSPASTQMPPFIHPEDFAAGFQTCLRAIQKRNSYQCDFRQRQADGEYRWITSHGQPRFGAEGNFMGYIGITLDITERKEVEDILRRHQLELQNALTEAESARERAEAADRSKDQFLAVLSHELRTPLTPVLLAAAALPARLDIPPQVRDALQMISHNVQLEARLIDDLLDLTRITRGTLELNLQNIDLHAVIGRALQICGSDLVAKGHRLHLALAAQQCAVYGDFARLQQVFWNLIKNAVKFTAADGTLYVRSKNVGNSVYIEIEDNGIGIEPSVLPKIFNSFEQGGQEIMRQFGGLGLGLAISTAVVSAHHGQLTASSPGKGLGATFCVQLPVFQP
jgi:PAS domain S-box-containing protein